MPVKQLLLLLLVLASGCGEKLTPVSVETPRGTVTYKERVRSDQGEFKEGIRDPSPSEARRLQQGSDMASAFIAKYVPSEQTHDDLLENLDRAFAAWLHSTEQKKESPDEVELVVGAAFGQYCIQRLPVHWAVTADSKGTEFVLVGEHPPSRSSPLAAVRYRIEDKKTDFIGALYEALVHIRKEAS